MPFLVATKFLICPIQKLPIVNAMFALRSIILVIENYHSLNLASRSLSEKCELALSSYCLMLYQISVSHVLLQRDRPQAYWLLPV